MEEYLFFLKFFSQLFYIHFYVVQKIKMPLIALSYDNHVYFAKSEKRQSCHYMLSLTFTTLGQQSMLATTEKPAVCAGRVLSTFTFKGQFQIFTLNSNVVSCSSFKVWIVGFCIYVIKSLTSVFLCFK